MSAEVSMSQDCVEGEYETVDNVHAITDEYHSNGCTALHRAVDDGNIKEVEWLVQEKGADIRSKDKTYGGNAMHWALREKQDIEVVKFLLRQKDGIDLINESDRDKMTPLMWGLYNNAATQTKKPKVHALLFILENDGKNCWGRNQDEGYNLNYDLVDKNGKSLLHLAAAVNDQRVLAKIVDKISGKNFKISDKRKELHSPLVIAAEEEIWENVKILLPEKWSYWPSDEYLAVSQVIQNCNCETLDNLLKNGLSLKEEQHPDKPYIHFTLKNKNSKEIVSFLVEKGIDICREHDGLTILHELSARGHKETITTLVQSLRGGRDNKEFTSLLDKICKKCKVSVQGELLTLHSCTPLQIAVVRQDPETVKLLLDYGADPFVKNNENHDSLDLLKSFRKISKSAIDIIKMLHTARIRTDVQRNIESNEKEMATHHEHVRTQDNTYMKVNTPLTMSEALEEKQKKESLQGREVSGIETTLNEILRKQHDVKRFLETHLKESEKELTNEEQICDVEKQQVKIKSIDGVTSLHQSVKAEQFQKTKKLLQNGSDPNILDDNSRSPLYYAVTGNMPEIVKLLLQFDGWMWNQVDRDGKSIIHRAVELGKPAILKLLLRFEVCSLDLLDNCGKSALHCAVEKGNSEILKLLLQSEGCKPDLEDAQGKTALYFAVHLERPDLINLLVQYGALQDGLLHMIAYEGKLKLFEKYYKEFNIKEQYSLGKPYEIKFIRGQNYDQKCTVFEIACLQGEEKFLQNIVEKRLVKIPADTYHAVQHWKGKISPQFKEKYDKIANKLSKKYLIRQSTSQKAPKKEMENDLGDKIMKPVEEKVKQLLEKLEKAESNDVKMKQELEELKELIQKSTEETKEVIKNIKNEVAGAFVGSAENIAHFKLLSEISRKVDSQPKIEGVSCWVRISKSLLKGCSKETFKKIHQKISDRNTSERDCMLESLLLWKYIYCYGILTESSLSELQHCLQEEKIDTTAADFFESEMEYWRQGTIAGYLSDKKFKQLAKELKNEWKELAKYLGIPASEVTVICTDHKDNAYQQMFNMLVKWREGSEGFQVMKIICLSKALDEIGRPDLACKLKSSICDVL